MNPPVQTKDRPTRSERRCKALWGAVIWFVVIELVALLVLLAGQCFGTGG